MSQLYEAHCTPSINPDFLGRFTFSPINDINFLKTEPLRNNLKWEGIFFFLSEQLEPDLIIFFREILVFGESVVQPPSKMLNSKAMVSQ